MLENLVVYGTENSIRVPDDLSEPLDEASQTKIAELEEEVRMLSSENKFFAAWISNILNDVVGSPGFPKDLDEALNIIANGGDPYD